MKATTLSTFLTSVDPISKAINTCVTGGAAGADKVWAATASTHSHDVAVMSFQGHVPNLHNCPKFLVRLSRKELDDADIVLQQANIHLRRQNWDMDLLKRNYHQVRYTSTLYVVSSTESKKASVTSVGIEGGSAWGTQMFLLRCVARFGKFEESVVVCLPMFFYDMTRNSWYQGEASIDSSLTLTMFRWKKMQTVPPRPCGLYTAIGSRQLTQHGENAIHQLFSQ
jgi:hypothetical protein